MSYSKLFVCDACGRDAEVVFAQEWQPGPDGEPAPYPGYGPVGGLLNRLWCARCAAVRCLLLVRLEPPAEHPVVAYAEAQRLGRTGAETGPCPECSEPLRADAEGEPCPDCHRGVLRLMGAWENS